MRVKCIKELDDNKIVFIDYTVDKIYFVEKSYKAKEMMFGSLETYYVIKDNFNDNHTFNQLGFEQHFISVSRERKNKLKKLSEKH